MSQTTVRFKTAEGLEYTRQGAVSAKTIIEQANEEFGTVEVLETRQGDEGHSDIGLELEQLIHTLEAASQNLGIVIDQLVSAEHIKALPNVKQQLSEARDAVEAELKDILNG